MEVEYISSLTCDEFEEEEEEEDSREWISQEDSNLSFSQIDQGEVAESIWGYAGKEEEEAEMELNEKENEERNARREDKLKRRAQGQKEKEKEEEEEKRKRDPTATRAVRIVYNTNLGYRYDEEDEQMEEEGETEIEKERRKTSAMMLRNTMQQQQEPTGQEEEEDLENEEREEEERTNRGNAGEKKARRRENAEIFEEMGLDDDIQLDFVEIFKVMLDKEKRHPRQFHWPAHLHPTRTKLIDWLSQMGEAKNLDLADRTVHLSVDILDAVNGGLRSVESLYLGALASLLIAAKHEETEEKVPTIEELITATGQRFTDKHLIKMELWVLGKIEWQVMRLTSVLFLENFVRRGACTVYLAEDRFNGQHIQPNKVASMEGYLNRYATFFCDVCLQDVELSSVAHSLIAAASLACARRALKLSPAWPDSLRKITTYENAQLASVVQRMWTIYLNTTQ